MMSDARWLGAMVMSISGALGGVVAQDAAAPTEPRSSEWTMHRGGPSLQGVAAGQLRDAPELAWSRETGDAILSSPVVADGMVYFGSSDQSIYALDVETGEVRWSFATQDMIEAPALVLDGRLFIGSCDFFFYALDAKTGELDWKYETDDKIIGGANWVRMADGSARVVVGSYDTHLYCFDAATGEKQWAYETDNYVNGTPAMWGRSVIFGGCDAILHVVSLDSGEATARVELGSDCHVAGSVAVAGDNAYFGHYGNEFICVDLKSDEITWNYASPRGAFFSSPAITSDRLVFGGRDKKVHCLQRDSGAVEWTFPTRRKVDGSPVICGDKVVVGSGDGRLYVLSLADGRELWNYDIGRPVFSSPAVVDGMIFVGANDGRLYAFDARVK